MMRRMTPMRIPPVLAERLGRRRRPGAGAAETQRSDFRIASSRGGGGRGRTRSLAAGSAALVAGASLAVGAACSGGAGGSGRDRAADGVERVAGTRPNIVWIVADAVEAAAVESLGGARTTISEAAAVASDPATARAALLTGVSSSALGIDEATGRLTGPPPAGVTVLPEQLRRAGYYTSRAGPPGHNLASGRSRPVKVVHVDGGVHEAARALPVPVADLAQPGLLGAWDAAGPDADWRGREKDWESPCTVAFGCGGARTPGARPFFALFNPPAGRSGREQDLAARVGRIVGALEAEGLLEDTVVFLIGAGGPTSTVAVRRPAGMAGAAEPDTPVGLLDLAPTALALAGVPAPQYMAGRAPAGSDSDARAVETEATTATNRKPEGFPAAGASAPVAAHAPVAATPAGYPTGGLFHVAPRVDLRCDTAGSTIVYTTEREAPFYWRLYTGPFRMRFWTLRFQCGRLGYGDSDIVTFDFDIE